MAERDGQKSGSWGSGGTLLDLFDRFADSPAKFVVYDDGYRIWNHSYREIGAAARGFAAKLESCAIGKGDKVLFWGENRAEWMAGFWGCLLRGVMVVPIDYRASAEVLRNVQKVVQAKAILAGEEVDWRELAEGIPVWRLAEMEMREAAAGRRRERIEPDDVAEIVFTSGSTAAPKGVLITHRNVVADLAPIEDEVRKYRRFIWPLEPIRFLNLLPLSHMFGQAVAAFFVPMLETEVVLTGGYGAHEVAQQIKRRGVSFLSAVPKMIELMRQYAVRRLPELAAVRADDSHWLVRRWRYRKVHRLFGWKFVGFVSGGAPLDKGLEDFWRALGFMVVQGYGLTETAPIVSFNHPFHLKPGTVGRVMPGVEVKIAADGEIEVRGEIVTPGYYSAPTEAAAAFENGWFHTGDIGTIDAQGYLTVRGRKKEMIVTPEGLKVFPEDVEKVIDGIAGVRESAVVGRERVHAVLVLEEGAERDEIVRQANARLEEHQKIRGVSVWSAGALPRTEGTGKLKRPTIQKWVDEGAPAAAMPAHDGIVELIQRYAPGRTITPTTTIDELGLSSLEQAELMVELEEHFDATIDEAAFRQAQRVSDLIEQMSKPTAPPEPFTVIDWNRGAAARMVRRVVTPGLVIPVARTCARITVKGLEALEGVAAPVIFASNHQSHLDVPIILTAIPRRWRYRIAPAMWKEFFDAYYHPAGYPVARRVSSTVNFYLATLLFNSFPIPQREAGVRETIRHAGELIGEGWSVLIFPEGERCKEIKQFHPGVGMLGARLRVPVVPIRLRGVNQVLPRYSMRVHRGPVEVVFGAPLELKGEDYQALAGKVEAAVRAL